MKYWIWLSLCLGFGNDKAKLLIDKFSTAEKVYFAKISEIIRVCDITTNERLKLENKSLSKAEQIIKEANKSSIQIIAYDNPLFPERLRNISNPPLCLYYKGDFPIFDKLPTICVVGTRKADLYSIRAAWSLSARLALSNVLVVSGGALGIDASAHRGCLDTKNSTVAFLACGINYPYLKANEPLRKEITSNGCLISEYPPNYPIRKSAFHERNRLMSGVSLGVVVIEAGAKSGALITARNAAEQGRDVFVITGKPSDPKYAGSNMLLSDGAKPVFDVSDILSEYYLYFGNIIDIEKSKSFNLKELYNSIYNVKSTSVISENNPIKTDEEKNILENIKETLSNSSQMVYNCIDSEYFTVDDISSTGLSVSEIFSAITDLEIKGLIKAVPGGRYTKVL